MSLSTGTRLGPYEILGQIGAGGMGEVYKARDSRLQREVAIKVCAEQFSDRFRREARSIAALNHPRICTLYDVGPNYLVMEYVEGSSLQGPMPVKNVLRLAIQMADALAAAHRRGIIHRDLKPANVMVTKSGVKLLDFGLAKTTEPVSGHEETTRTIQPVTGEGAIVGTIAYMSPEQAQGKPVDSRSDIFSFGSVLYEMLTGKQPFRGDNNLSVLSAILKDEPEPVRSSCPEIPKEVERILAHCLHKDPEQRYQHATDIKIALEDTRAELESHSQGPAAQAVPLSKGLTSRVPGLSSAKRVLPMLLALAGFVAGVALGVFLFGRAPGISDYRFTPLVTEATDQLVPEWSPDGQSVVYVGRVDGVLQIFTRTLDSAVSSQITKSKTHCLHPFWSPDGTRIFYLSRGQLFSVGATGGEPQVVFRPDDGAGPVAPSPATISPDAKTMAFFRTEPGPVSALWILPSSGKPHRYKQSPMPETFRFSGGARFSPDGKKLAVSFVERIGDEGVQNIWIVPYPSGQPWRVAAHLRNFSSSGCAWMPDSRHLVIDANSAGEDNHLYYLDTETGAVEAITGGDGQEASASVSPDGKKLAFTNGRPDLKIVDVSIADGSSSILLATSRRQRAAAWSPSGNLYLYNSDATGKPAIWLRNVTEGTARRLVANDIALANGARFSPDGQRFAYVQFGPKHMVLISQLSGGRSVPLEQESSDQHAPAWSPDGNWIAYTRFAAGGWQIAKAPSGGGGQPVKLEDTASQSTILDWSPTGEWIGYNSTGLRLVSPDGQNHRQLTNTAAAAWGFSRDGTRVHVIERRDTSWVLSTISLAQGGNTTTVVLDLPKDAVVTDFSLHPDGKHFATSVVTTNRTIWLLEGFPQPAGWFRRQFLR